MTPTPLDADAVRSLIWSLGQFAHDGYHRAEVLTVLAQAFPNEDFSSSLNRFERITDGRLVPDVPVEDAL